MVSRFMKVFRENILTMQLLHLTIVKQILYKREEFVPNLYFNTLRKKKESNIWELYNRSIFMNMPDIKEEDFEPKYFSSLASEMDSFLDESLSTKDVINYISRNAINFTFTEIENYFFKCFKELYKMYPKKIQGKLLKLKRFIEHEFDRQRLLEFASYDEAEKIHKTPIRDILYEAKNDHGINHQIEHLEIEKLESLKQIRNIFTHGDGTITRRYLKKVRRTNYELGQKFMLSFDLVNYYQSLAFEVIKKFDMALTDKYPVFIAK